MIVTHRPAWHEVPSAYAVRLINKLLIGEGYTWTRAEEDGAHTYTLERESVRPYDFTLTGWFFWRDGVCVWVTVDEVEVRRALCDYGCPSFPQRHFAHRWSTLNRHALKDLPHIGRTARQINKLAREEARERYNANRRSARRAEKASHFAS